jgi:hypothetical protein
MKESAALRIGSAGRFARPLPVVIPHKGGSASNTPPDETPAAYFSPPPYNSILEEEPLHLFMESSETRPRLARDNLAVPRCQNNIDCLPIHGIVFVSFVGRQILRQRRFPIHTSAPFITRIIFDGSTQPNFRLSEFLERETPK